MVVHVQAYRPDPPPRIIGMRHGSIAVYARAVAGLFLQMCSIVRDPGSLIRARLFLTDLRLRPEMVLSKPGGTQ